MNPHILKGYEAIRNGDYDTAKAEFGLALEDPDEKVRAIAQNRLREIEEDGKKVWTTTFGHYYHREGCTAENATNPNYPPQYNHWTEAKSNGYSPCPRCTPPEEPPWPGLTALPLTHHT